MLRKNQIFGFFGKKLLSFDQEPYSQSRSSELTVYYITVKISKMIMDGLIKCVSGTVVIYLEFKAVYILQVKSMSSLFVCIKQTYKPYTLVGPTVTGPLTVTINDAAPCVIALGKQDNHCVHVFSLWLFLAKCNKNKMFKSPFSCVNHPLAQPKEADQKKVFLTLHIY